MESFFMVGGFLIACWAVISNDSLQTLGTFISSNSDRKWYWLFLASALVLVGTLVYGWYMGDVSWGRLEEIPLPEQFTIWHLIAPTALLTLTFFGIPVSTTFLILSVFATEVVMTKMIMKSVMGYAIAFIVAFLLWKLIKLIIDEKRPIENQNVAERWRIAQWFATMFLWSQWLSHDVANMAVYLDRSFGIGTLIMFISVLVLFLGIVFYSKGGRIQRVLINKTSTKYIRSATLIDIAFALILLVFKEMSSIPMSTTWVFVGLLAGRELAINHDIRKRVFPILLNDFLKVLLGLSVSVCVALLASYFIGQA